MTCTARARVRCSGGVPTAGQDPRPWEDGRYRDARPRGRPATPTRSACWACTVATGSVRRRDSLYLETAFKFSLIGGGDSRSAFPRNNMPNVVRCLHHTAGTGALDCFFIGSAGIAKHEP